MQLAIISDIHDNQVRLAEALAICAKNKIESCICCGDVGSLATAQKIFDAFRNIYFALGNADFSLYDRTGLFPDNVTFGDSVLEFEIDGLHIAVVHHDYKTRALAESGEYDFIFYGHSHTPWEKKMGKTIVLNPGEVAGQYGQASFAIFDTETKKATLKLLR